MKVAVFESIITPGGHEHDFDKMLISELKQAGHEVELVVPEGYPFKLDYGVTVRYLKGDAVSYTGASRLTKLFLSTKREWRRIQWFGELMKYALTGAVDTIIIPTATYRFLRSIRLSALKRSPIPVIALLHGINTKEAPKFLRQVEALRPYPTIHPTVITLDDRLFGLELPTVTCVLPPVYPPASDLEVAATRNGPLTLGFFGQYRREKNLDAFLDAFLQCRFTVPVELLVQGATVLPGDAADFQRIAQKYSHASHIRFLHKALIGREWQEAIAGVDALIMPYSAERYLYHWSAMLFTAIGFRKAVVVADTINPQVLEKCEIGLAFNPSSNGTLQLALERFVNTYAEKRELYRQELSKANEMFSPAQFVKAILANVSRS